MRQLRLLMTLVSVAVANFALALSFTSEGLRFLSTSDSEMTVEVAGWDKNYYTNAADPSSPAIGVGEDGEPGPAAMVIPWRVLYNGLWYRVTGISEDAFADCTSLTSVTIPNTIEYIGEYAFQGCTKLKSVKVQWLTPLAVDANVFDGVDLPSVTLMVLSGYKDVYQAADVWKDFGKVATYADTDVLMIFEDPAVKEICVQNWDTNFDGELSYREAVAVTDLGGAFTGNTEIRSFKELRSFNKLTIIGSAAFYGCSALEEITIAPNVTTIEDQAFYGCESLGAISLSTKITKVGDHAFDGCASLKTFTVPRYCTYVGEGALANCSSLTSINVASGNTAYTYSSKKYGLLTKDQRTLVAFSQGLGGTLTIPSTVTNVAPYAVAGGAKFTAINLANVETIGDNAFQGLAALKSLTITESVMTIGREAFADCSNLYTVYIPETLMSIGRNAFKNVKKGIRVQVAWPSPLMISDGTFSTAEAVAEGEVNGRLFVPEGTKAAYQAATGWKWFNFAEECTIAEYAGKIIQFADEKTEAVCVAAFDADHDGYVTYDEAAAVTSLGDAFKNAEIGTFAELQYFTSLAAIGDGAFSGSTVTTVTFPENLVSIGADAFAYCDKLKTVTIPEGVAAIGNGAFKACAALTAINVDENNSNYTSGSGVLFTKDHSVLLQYPAKRNASSVTVPDGVTTIAPEAFLNATLLKSITVLPSVAAIGEKAFAGCKGLTTFQVYWDEPLGVPADIFEGVEVADATLNVPVGLSALYEEAEVWRDFGTRSEFTDNNSPIRFADATVQEICVTAWDANGDGKLTYNEAKAVTSLEGKFEGNENITSFDELQYFTGVTAIADNEFKNAKALTSVVFPTTLQTIGKSTFEGCDNLAKAPLVASLTSVDEKAFYGTAITSVGVQARLAYIGPGAFGNCQNLATVTVNASNKNYFSTNRSNVIFTRDTTTIVLWPATKTGTPSLNAKVKHVYPYAFSGASKITAVTFNNVETIGDYAFEGCNQIKTLNIGEQVTTIGEGAFAGCSAAQTINIPESVTQIGAKAFEGMPVGVRCEVKWNSPVQIEAATFTNAETPAEGQLKGILFVPVGTKSLYEGTTGWDFFDMVYEGNIEEYNATLIAFADPQVEKLAVAAWDTDGDNKLSYDEAAAVTSLGNVFTDQTIGTFNELQYFVALTEIGDDAFRNTGLAAVTMPQGVTRIGNSAYMGTAISTFNALPNLVEIADSAFAYNTGFTSLTISDKITTVGVGAFKGCQKLTAIKVNNANPNYMAADGVLYDKAQTRLMQFPAGKKLSAAYTINSKVTAIDEDAFLMVETLNDLFIPIGVTSIGENAFRATGITRVTVEWHEPLEVPSNVFDGVDLANATLLAPKGTTDLYAEANVWREFGQIEMYLDDVAVIDFADENVKALCVGRWDTDDDGELTVSEAKKVVTLSTIFKENADITSFDELQYFTGLTSIPADAFRECISLQSVTLPASVTNVATGSFNGCVSLQTINLPAKVTSVGNGAFANCSELTSITVDEANTRFVAEDGVLYNASKTALVAYPAGKEGAYEMPSTVTVVNPYSMCGASKVTGIKMSKAVITVGEGAFRKCGMEFINIPASVTNIGRWAFMECQNLKVVKLGWTTPLSVPAAAFQEFDYTDSRLYVPAGSRDAYAEKDVWMNFETIVEYPNCDVNEDGYADMLDVVDIVRYAVGVGLPVFDPYLADFDDDEEVTVADAVALVGMIAEGTAAPNLLAAPARNLQPGEVTLAHDANGTVALAIDSTEPFTAFQFDLTVPEGAEVDLAQLSNRLKGHQLVYNRIDERTYRFAAVSLANKAFADQQGTVLYVKTNSADADEVKASNIRLVTTDGATVKGEAAIEANPTAIADMQWNTKAQEGVYYNLSGQRVDKPGKGVYIIDGKKVIIK